MYEYPPKLKKNGWEFAINNSQKIEAIQLGDLVKIIIMASIDDLDEPIRSISEHTLWVKVEKEENTGYIGTIKSIPEHPFQLKDGTEFKLNETIFFKIENVILLRKNKQL